MFKKILIVILMFCGAAFGDVSKDRIRFDTMTTTDGIVLEVRNLIDDINTELRNAGGRFSNVGTGNIYYVDSAVGNDSYVGTRPEWATATFDAAVALTTANNGDVIVGLQGHTEDLTAADAVDVDVAGVAVIGLGDGVDAPELNYTRTAAEFVIGAANVTLYNLRFVCASVSVPMAISIEDAGDYATIASCVFPEPATITNEFLDGIDFAADAHFTQIYNNIYRHTSTTGPAHFIEAGNGLNKDVRIVGNDIAGEFSVSAIWSDWTQWWWHIERNNITNLTSGQHAIEFTTTAEGMIVYNNIFADATATSIDPGSMFCIENYVAVTTDESGILYPHGPLGPVGD